jgi:excinuclease UvrABC nuclease subunit
LSNIGIDLLSIGQDVSHTQGEFPVASRVVFIDGKPTPHLYRKFNIKTVEGIDDYASIEEVLERRFLRIPESNDSGDDPWAMPDLVSVTRFVYAHARKRLLTRVMVPLGGY